MISLLLQEVTLPAYEKKHLIGSLSLYPDMIKRFQGSFVFSAQAGHLLCDQISGKESQEKVRKIKHTFLQ
jgi:hypothetical protein